MPAIPSENRYTRQLLLHDIGADGQAKFAAARVVIVGCGALGSVAAELLARAGVGLSRSGGELRLIDRDVVEWTNLHRQMLFVADDVEKCTPKAIAAAEAIKRINFDVHVTPIVADCTAQSILDVLGEQHPTVILDGTDNFETRFLLNDIAVKQGIPLVYAGAIATRGMLATILPAPAPDDSTPLWTPGPCLRCLIDMPPPGSTETCDTAGVLGPVSAAVACFQAVESMKIILGRFDLLRRHVLEFDPWQCDFKRLDMGEHQQSPECPCCCARQFEFLDALSPSSTVLCGSDAVQVTPIGNERHAIDLPALANRLHELGEFSVTPYLLKGELAGEMTDAGDGAVRLSVFTDGRAIIHGTRKPDRARALYARFVGA